MAKRDPRKRQKSTKKAATKPDAEGTERSTTRRGRALTQPRFQGRVGPAADADAFTAVERFIADHQRAYDAVKFGKPQVDAGRKVHTTLVKVIAEAGESLRRGPRAPADAQQTLERAHRLLFLARDGIRRLGKTREDVAARKHFGFDVKLARQSPEQLRQGIKAFLAGARRDKATLERAFIQPAFIDNMKKSSVDLDDLIARKTSLRRNIEETNAEGTQAHEALEDFYTAFAAATNMAFIEDEATRIVALRLVPRERARRRTKQAPASPPADSDAPPEPPPT